MEAEDPLSQLADIHLPDAVSSWPPAPGWWLLAALVLLLLALLVRKLLQRTLVRRKLHAALRELDVSYQSWQAASQIDAQRNQAGLDLLYSFNTILKRVALVHFPDADVARLSGSAWLQFLDAADGSHEFTTGAGQALSEGAYQPTFKADADALYPLCKRWISKRFLNATKAASSAAAGHAKAAQPEAAQPKVQA